EAGQVAEDEALQPPRVRLAINAERRLVVEARFFHSALLGVQFSQAVVDSPLSDAVARFTLESERIGEMVSGWVRQAVKSLDFSKCPERTRQIFAGKQRFDQLPAELHGDTVRPLELDDLSHSAVRRGRDATVGAGDGPSAGESQVLHLPLKPPPPRRS